jgi:hypothetical protein
MKILDYLNKNTENIIQTLGEITVGAILLFVCYGLLRLANLLPGFAFDPLVVGTIIAAGYYLGKKIDRTNFLLEQNAHESKQKELFTIEKTIPKKKALPLKNK